LEVLNFPYVEVDMFRLFLTLFSTTLLLLAQQSLAAEQEVPSLLSPGEDSVAPQVRVARSKVFRGGFSIFEPGPPPITAVTLKPMGELPVDQSDTVIVGEVTHMQPFLTYDGRGLYTECTIRNLETIKSVVPITSESIVLLRRGGEVRLPEGRVVRSVVIGDGDLPVVGHQYLFFLNNRSEADAYLLTKMWLIQEGLIRAVFPDDRERVNRGQSAYDGAYLATVLASLKAGVSQ
jgi:hypothetical protein